MLRRTLQLVVLKPLATFRHCGLVSYRNPPKTVVRPVHPFKPLGAIFQNVRMLRAIDVVAQGFDRLPDRHVHDDEWIVVVRNVGRVSRIRFQPPDKTFRSFCERIYRIELCDEFLDAWVVNRGNEPADIDLCEVMVGRLSRCGIWSLAKETMSLERGPAPTCIGAKVSKAANTRKTRTHFAAFTERTRPLRDTCQPGWNSGTQSCQ